MLGRSAGKLLFICTAFVASCGSQEFENEVTRRRLIAWIDERQYERVLSYVELEATEKERVAFQSLLAQAHMGLGEFEVLEILANLKGEQVMRGEAFRAMSRDCPMTAVSAKKIKSLEDRCAMVRLFNTLPNPDNPNLLRARDIWRKLQLTASPKLSDSDHLLALTLETAVLIARAGAILEEYYELSADTMNGSDVDAVFRKIEDLARDADQWIGGVEVFPKALNLRFLGDENSALFERTIAPKLKFSAKSAIHKLLSIVDVKNESTEARFVRAKIIHKLDLILVDYFKVDFEE